MARSIAAFGVTGLLIGVAWAADHRVSQRGQAFAPTLLNVGIGDRIVFANDDAQTHNVYSATSGFAFDLKVQNPGDSASITVDKQGRFDVRCAIHPRMRMTVVVE